LWWAGRTLWHLSSAANYLGEWDASRKYSRRALEHGTALNDLRLKTVSWWRIGVAHILQGDLELGRRCCDEALALAPNMRDAAMARAARGYGEIKAGRIEAGISELNEAVAWFRSSQLRFTHLNYALWLAEGHLRRGDRASARTSLDHVLKTSRETGYLLFEGRADWLIGNCLAAETPILAEDHADSAMRILERIGARNDFGKAMVLRASLRQRARDTTAARRLLGEAQAIFQALDTRDELARVKVALSALDNGLEIRTLVDGS
jgi:tetratricopeptide (TPR) repeat protein